MIYTVTLNPAIDKTAEVEEFVAFGLNRLQKIKIDAGGKGINVSKTIRAMGYHSTAFGFIGGSTGTFIREELTRRGIETDFIEVEATTRTNLKVLDKAMRLTELNEQGSEISSSYEEVLINKILSNLKKDDILVLSGSIPQGISVDIYKKIIEACSKVGAKSILDADGKMFAQGIQAKPYCCKPNQVELCTYFGLARDCTMDELVLKAHSLVNGSTKLVVLSCGEEGAWFITKEKAIRCEALKINLKSSVGAGDAMVAALAVSLERKDTLEQIIRCAMASGAGACETEGTEPANKERLEELMEQVKLEEVKI